MEEQLSNYVTLGVPLFDSATVELCAHPAFASLASLVDNLAYKIKTNDMLAVALER